MNATIHSRRKSNAFTLLELLIVMAIIAILAAISIQGMSYAQNNAARKKTTAQMEMIKLGLTKYQTENGTYPANSALNGSDILYETFSGDTNNDGIVEATPMFDELSTGTNSKLGMVKTNATGAYVLVDGFGNEFRYLSPGTINTNTYDLWSIADTDVSAGITNPTFANPNPTTNTKYITNW